MTDEPILPTLWSRLERALAELDKAREHRLQPKAIERLEIAARQAEARLVRAIDRG